MHKDAQPSTRMDVPADTQQFVLMGLQTAHLVKIYGGRPSAFMTLGNRVACVKGQRSVMRGARISTKHMMHGCLLVCVQRLSVSLVLQAWQALGSYATATAACIQ